MVMKLKIRYKALEQYARFIDALIYFDSNNNKEQSVTA